MKDVAHTDLTNTCLLRVIVGGGSLYARWRDLLRVTVTPPTAKS